MSLESHSALKWLPYLHKGMKRNMDLMKTLLSRGAWWQPSSAQQTTQPVRALWNIGWHKAKFRTHIKSLVFWTLNVFRGCNAHRLLDLQQDIAKCLDLLHFPDFWKQIQQNTQNIKIYHLKNKFNTLNIYSIFYAIKPSLDNFRSSTQTDSLCAATGSLWQALRTATPLLPRLPRLVDTAIE